jgi:hypothetical protein
MHTIEMLPDAHAKKKIPAMRGNASYVLYIDGTGRIAAGSHEVLPCTILTASA